MMKHTPTAEEKILQKLNERGKIEKYFNRFNAKYRLVEIERFFKTIHINLYLLYFQMDIDNTFIYFILLSGYKIFMNIEINR